MQNNNNQFNGNMPPQGYYQKPKKPWYTRWYMIVIYVFVGLGVIGSIGSQNKKDSATTSSSNSDTKDAVKTEETKKEEVKDTYAIGEEVTLNNHVLKVNSVQRSQGTEWDKPKDGHEFVIVNITISNSGKDTVSYNPFDFKMQNSQGNITDKTFTTVDSSTTLNSGELASGGTVTGTIAFEQPTGDKGLIVKYKSNFFSNKEIKVKIDQ